MTPDNMIDKTISFLQTERKCVLRQGTPKCPNRECEKCDLVLPEEDVIAAYNSAIELLKELKFYRSIIPSIGEYFRIGDVK